MTMNRRNFIRNSTAAATLLGVASCTLPDTEKSKNAEVFTDDFALKEATLDDLQKKMRDGTLTSRSITELYLQRIAAIDKSGPHLNAVIEVNPDALEIAEGLDKERKSGKLRGALHGIPVLVKDNINTGDKMMTTAGSLALLGNIADKDAFIIKQLREAGAVVLGKTNLSEWANFRSTRSTSGWSSRGGQTKNPYALDRNPSGSSSGSGAATAANLCAVAIGTETNGSIISPASDNGIVGVKPTVGLLSRSGIIPIAKTQDTAGSMTRTVKDAAILLGALTGVDENDETTLNSKGRAYTDYTSFLDINGLKGKRIGIEQSFLTGPESVVAFFRQGIEVLKNGGATIIEIELLKQTNELGDASYALLQFEFKDGLNRYLAQTRGQVKSLTDLIKFNKENEGKVMPYFKQEILESSEEKKDLNSTEYIEAYKKTISSRGMIDEILRKHQLDAICATSGGPASCIDLVNGDYWTGPGFSSPAAMAGYPHITIPMGAVQELPVGISFMAGAYKEPELFAIAYAYEQASNKRTPPKFLKTAIAY